MTIIDVDSPTILREVCNLLEICPGVNEARMRIYRSLLVFESMKNAVD